MTTGQLNRIAFFNTDRFPYAEIEVDGNTMISGTNGVGKTTTMQSVLFFYGASTSKLGIKTGSGEKTWLEYAYPFPNSYTIYQYDGIAGKNLLLTYAAGNQIAYKFASIENIPNLAEIMFAPGTKTVAAKERVLAEFAALDIHFTTKTIKGTERYRSILYGNSTGDDRKNFGEFAMMKTTRGYNQIPNVLSSIFLNSSMDGTMLEGAIAGTIATDGEIDLMGLRKDCSFIREYRQSIRSFEETKSIRSNLFEEMDRHGRYRAELTNHVNQMVAMKNKAEDDLPALIAAADASAKEYDDAIERHKADKSKAWRTEQDRLDAKKTADASYRAACDLRDYYSDGSILGKIEEVARLDEYRGNLDAEKSLYNELIGEQQNIVNIYDARINEAKSNAVKQKEIIANEMLMEQENADALIKRVQTEQKNELSVFDADLEPKKAELQKTKEKTRAYHTEVQLALTILQNKNPHESKAIGLKEQLHNVESEKEKMIHSLDAAKSEYARAAEAIKKLNRDKQQVSENAKKLADLACVPLLEKIAEQRNLLTIKKESLLGFIRERNHPSEGAITSLLKEEVLLSEALSPAIVNLSERTFYGLAIDESALTESSYDTETIESRIEELKDQIESVRQRYEEEARVELEECGKQILAEMQKQEDSERESGSLRGRIVEHENKINRLKEEIEAEEKQARYKWENELKEKELLLAEAKTADDNAVKAFDAFHDEAERDRNVIRERSDTKIANIKAESTGRIGQMKQRREQAGVALTEELIRLESEKNSALEGSGIDKETLRAINKRIDDLKKKIEKAEQWQSDVKVYERDKVTIDTIPQLEVKLISAEKAHNDASLHTVGVNARCEKEAQELAKKAEKDKTKKSEAEVLLKEASESLPKFEKRTDIILDAVPRLSDDGLNFSRHHMGALAADNGVESSLNSIIRYVNQVASRVKTKDSELFPFLENVAQRGNYLAVAEEMASFVREGGLEAAKEMVASNFFETLKLIREGYDKVMRGSDKAREVVNGTNRVLTEAIDGIPILDELKLEHRESDDDLLRSIEKLKDVEIPIGDKSSLFWEEENSTKFVEAYSLFSRFVDELFKTNRKRIEVTDTYDIFFGVAENERPIKWARSREKIGSTGTTIIAKTLIYIALLEAILLKSKVQNNPMVHVLLDEIGTLSQENMQRILDFANSHGIVLFNAAPEPKLPRLYNRTYLYKLLKGKARVFKVEHKARGAIERETLAES